MFDPINFLPFDNEDFKNVRCQFSPAIPEESIEETVAVVFSVHAVIRRDPPERFSQADRRFEGKILAKTEWSVEAGIHIQTLTAVTILAIEEIVGRIQVKEEPRGKNPLFNACK